MIFTAASSRNKFTVYPVCAGGVREGVAPARHSRPRQLPAEHHPQEVGDFKHHAPGPCSCYRIPSDITCACRGTVRDHPRHPGDLSRHTGVRCSRGLGHPYSALDHHLRHWQRPIVGRVQAMQGPLSQATGPNL
jgi:hypothetical protein